MDFFDINNSTNIDLREEIHKVIYGSSTITPQGKDVLVRRLTDQVCTGCWNPNTGGPSITNCSYCDGEGYVFSETIEKMFIAKGVAPIYKPGVLGTGIFPQSAYGFTDPNKATAYCEWSVFPNYERYTVPLHKSFDKIYELKVDGTGKTIKPLVRAGKWYVFSLTPMFGDYGRVEYIEVGLSKINL